MDGQNIFPLQTLLFLGRPTLVKMEKYDVYKDVKLIHKALKCITNKKAIIDILCSRTNLQRIEIVKVFKTCYDRSLIDDVRRIFRGDFWELLNALLTPVNEFYCRELFNALNQPKMDEEALIQILVVLSNRDIYDVNQRYVKNYGKTLESDLRSDTNGTFRKLLIGLANGTRDESNVLELYSARVDVMELQRAGVDRWGTDARVFNRVLCLRNFDQIRLISQEYESVTGHPLEQAIKKEFSGDIRNGLLAILRVSKNRPEFFARCLYKAMLGFGYNDKSLIRLVVTRCEIDMLDIKEEFQRYYGKSLKSFIESDTSGKYRKALLKLIAE